MKTRIFLTISVSLLLCMSILSRADVIKNSDGNQTAQINIASTGDLQGLTHEWAREYNQQHPELLVQVDLIAEPGEILKSSGQLAFIHGTELDDLTGWKMSVGREVIVPVMNTSSPYFSEIAATGVSQAGFRELFLDPAALGGTRTGKGQNNPLSLCLVHETSVINGVKKFLEINAIAGHVVLFDNDEQMLSAIRSNPEAIGFCSLSGIIDPASGRMADHIMIIPIDKNANGKLDYMENIYSDLDAFSRGVWIGKYPKDLTNDIYAVSSAQPADETQIAFLSWVLIEGQVALALNGFSELVYSEVQSKLDKFNDAGVIVPVASKAISIRNLILFILAGALLLGIMAGAMFGFGRKAKMKVLPETMDTGSFDERTVNVPGGLYYDKSHTWAFMEKDGTVKVGIDDFMQHITGPITRVEMKKPGEKVTKGELFLSLIQKGKQLKLYAPVTGTILECNDSLENNAFMLNTAPYSEGWVYRLEPANWLKEISILSMAGKYTKWLSGEFSRLKDFLAHSIQSHKLEYANVVLQDGGALRNNLLEDFGPEVWEDFQSKFIDTNK